MSSRRWRRAALTSRGTTSRRTRPSCGRTAASAYTTISISLMPSLAWSICGCRHGRRGLAEIHKLYRCHDRLLEHKQALFDHLVGRWRDLFNVSFDVLLYDLTSTYFEADPRCR